MKLPKRGWMTLRWTPMRPRPAATATGLWPTTQILPGKRSISIGKPAEGFMAWIPRSSRAVTTLRATSLEWSYLAWNPRLEPERARRRMGPRFIRQRKLRSVLACGKARRMSARWSSRAGRLISTRPASSAPQSRHNRRSQAASRGFGGSAQSERSPSRKRRTVGCSASFMTPPRLLHVQISTEKNTGRSRFGPGLPQLLCRPVEQGDPLAPQQFGGLALRFFPGRDRLLDQALALGGEPEGLGTGVLVGHDLQPAVSLQRLDVAAESGGVQLQDVADLGGPGQAEPGGHDQDVQLADLQAQRAQGVVVEALHHPVQEPQAHGDARPGDRVDA